MKTRDTLKIIIRSVNDFICDLAENDIEKLSSGDYTISYKIVKLKNKNIDKIDILSETSFLEIIDLLDKCSSRLEGLNIIDNKFKSKLEIEKFAKFIDVAVMKSDKVDKIKNNIVESTVGARIRSEAIQKKEI
ncbi:hypothetical protein [Yersinia kristensenii]|uniref:Uncharacterized protein n=1 Tax=Yersinia kristensenii TaxID=28152 RepID=A0AB73Q1N0_YERKR|nr:hypothetical protein [Yersinia kristensenii]OVZ79556.1 hypothetical protein CBW52_14960 [Yersinia kristensenii]